MATIFDARSVETLQHFIQQGLAEGQSLSDIVNAKCDHSYEKGAVLHIIIIHNKCEMIHELMKNHANVNIQDKDGNTPLHWLINYDYFSVIDVLVSYQVDINKPNFYGQTPLHKASLEGRFKIVKDLLERGGDYTLRDHKNRTPKDLAVELRKEQAELVFGSGIRHMRDLQPIIELLQRYEDISEIKEPDS